MVRKMSPVRAILTLKFTNKAAALPLRKAIQTAIANAKVKNVAPEKLVFKTLEIGEGPRARRWYCQARGRLQPYKKRTSQIRIVLIDEKGAN